METDQSLNHLTSENLNPRAGNHLQPGSQQPLTGASLGLHTALLVGAALVTLRVRPVLEASRPKNRSAAAAAFFFVSTEGPGKAERHILRWQKAARHVGLVAPGIPLRVLSNLLAFPGIFGLGSRKTAALAKVGRGEGQRGFGRSSPARLPFSTSVNKPLCWAYAWQPQSSPPA